MVYQYSVEGAHNHLSNIIATEASFLVRSRALNFAIHIYIFQVDCYSVNVLNVSTCI